MQIALLATPVPGKFGAESAPAELLVHKNRIHRSSLNRAKSTMNEMLTIFLIIKCLLQNKLN